MDTPPEFPGAVLWDMDGTLLDSEPIWIAQETALVERFGGTWTAEDGYTLVGQSLIYSAHQLIAAGVDMEPEAVVDTLVEGVVGAMRRQVPWQHDALPALTRFAAAGIRQGLVTSSYTSMATVTAEAAQVFEVRVTGDECEKGKPDPYPYALAASRMKLSPQECIAVEDSPTGVASARAAGMRSVAVIRDIEIPAQSGLSRLATLDDFTVEAARAVVAGQTLDTVSS